MDVRDADFSESSELDEPNHQIDHAPWCTRTCHADTGTDECASAITMVAGACLWLVRGDVAPAGGGEMVRADRIMLVGRSVMLDGVARDQLVETLQGYQLSSGAGLN